MGTEFAFAGGVQTPGGHKAFTTRAPSWQRTYSALRALRRIPHVLVVDEEAAIPRFVRTILGQGARVFPATSAIDARRVLERGGIDVVVSDFELGIGENGAALLEDIQRRWPFVRRLLMSSGSPDVASLLEKGAIEHFLPKPIQPTDVLVAIFRE